MTFASHSVALNSEGRLGDGLPATITGTQDNGRDLE